MFGIYTDKRITKQESRILKDNPDDYNWYCIYMQTVFRDGRFFQVREDIKLPQEENDDGVVLMVQGGEIIYFKTLDRDVNSEEVESIFQVCSYLEKKFHQPIKSYVVMPPDCEVKTDKIDGDGEITIVFSKLGNDDGEEIIERLENKLKNHEEFTYSDSIDHMLLPYTGFKDKKVFMEKFRKYMALVEEYEGV